MSKNRNFHINRARAVAAAQRKLAEEASKPKPKNGDIVKAQVRGPRQYVNQGITVPVPYCAWFRFPDTEKGEEFSVEVPRTYTRGTTLQIRLTDSKNLHSYSPSGRTRWNESYTLWHGEVLEVISTPPPQEGGQSGSTPSP